MFWAITCEDGKQYSQVPLEPFRVSMAALEPRDKIPSNKQVSLMVESKGKEFLLCTLEYGRVMQVNLDLRFSNGEKFAFFVNGEGNIHLSGHLLAQETTVKPAKTPGVCLSANVSEDQYAGDEGGVSETHRLFGLDDSGDEDSEDWKPEVSELEDTFGSNYLFGSRPQTRSRSARRVNFAVQNEIEIPRVNYALPEFDVDEEENEEEFSDSADDEDQSSSDDEADDDDDDKENGDENEENIENSADEENEKEDSVSEDDDKEAVLIQEMREKKKRKKAALVNSAKRPKTEEKVTDNNVVIEYHGLSSESKKSKKKSKKKISEFFAAEENLDETSVESNHDLLNSSIGRTPMPKKKGSAVKLRPDSNAVPTFSQEKNFEKRGKFANILQSGVEYEDLKIGAGPPAKQGKMVHIHYVGRLENGEVFDKIMPSKKPLSFRLGDGAVFKGLDVGLEGMRAGGKRWLKIPPHMGYGKKSHGPVPANSTMIFNIELKAVS